MNTALTIAGSDSVGGAGIQADIKAMASLGIHAATVITALTSQNTREVMEIMPISEDMVQSQLKAVFRDCKIRAIKTGMLHNAGIVEVVADFLEDHSVPLVIDPVMVATVGDSLSDDNLCKALKRKLLPLCELITPNKSEAEALSGIRIRNQADITMACEIIGKEGSSVLLKGGHFDHDSIVDHLYLSSTITQIKHRRLESAGHGSGCALSAFITANLAKGQDLMNAILNASKCIERSIEEQYPIGQGVPVVRSNLDCMSDTKSISRDIGDVIPKPIVNEGYTVNESVRVHQNRINGIFSLEMKYNKGFVDVIEEVGYVTYRLKGNQKGSLIEMLGKIEKELKCRPDAIIDSNLSKMTIIGSSGEDLMEKLKLLI